MKYNFVPLSVFFSVALILLSACGAGVNSDSEELSEDSFYFRTGSYGYVMSHNELHKTIFPRVIDYSYNIDFVLIYQVPDYDAHRLLLDFELSRQPGFLGSKVDSVLKHDPYYIKILSSNANYWIIVNKTHDLIGPMNKGEYENKRRELRVPADLVLDVDS